MKTLTIALYICSALVLPWWAVTAFALVLLSLYRAYISVLVGAIILDALYGTSSGIGGSLYMSVFAALSLLLLFLKARLLE